ncbi:HNH endonuclease [Ruminiclostridium cellobioparum]|uniref:HNH endonuclease n=1 Tax=Ruminiclostridium cellobioparum TaxID=29355 RepID=UPI00310169F2
MLGIPFQHTSEIHCHHITPKQNGGGDKYENLILVHETVHKLIHASRAEKIPTCLHRHSCMQQSSVLVHQVKKRLR